MRKILVIYIISCFVFISGIYANRHNKGLICTNIAYSDTITKLHNS
jgi:hypothetical protein